MLYFIAIILQFVSVICYLAFCYYKRNTTKGVLVRLISASVAVICCIPELVFKMQVDKPNWLTLISFACYYIMAMLACFELLCLAGL